MSASTRLAALFVASPASAGAAEPAGAPGERHPLRAVPDAVPHSTPGATGAAAGPRACLLGGGRESAALGGGLAQRLARQAGGPPALLCVAGPRAGAAVAVARWAATPAARRAARALAAAGVPAAPHGRAVAVALPADPAAFAGLLARVRASVPPGPQVLVLPGAREGALDEVVAGHDLVVAVLPARADAALSALAVAGLVALDPRAAVLAVPLPARHGGAARRAALAQLLAALP